MKHLAPVAVLLPILVSVAATQQRPDFTGTWVLDVARSSINPSPELPLEPETLVVSQTEKELRFERQSASETTTQVALFDDPVVASTERSGAVSGIRASWNRSALVLTGWTGTAESRRSGPGRRNLPPPTPSQHPSAPRLEPQAIVTWSLGDGGRTLTINGLAVRTWEEPTGERVTEQIRANWVYRKQ